MSDSMTAISREALSAAISKVEKIHNYRLDSISQFIDEHESDVLLGFTSMMTMSSIDQKFMKIESIFSDHPDFEEHSPFLVEVAALVS
ncbi:hypothetical protein [Vibrio sp. HN007]|uniref:hypothetical protein n=1 Tax=Vibrio iocasae TaxID=3098914 RepID=UPI0035D4CF2E